MGWNGDIPRRGAEAAGKGNRSSTYAFTCSVFRRRLFILTISWRREASERRVTFHRLQSARSANACIFEFSAVVRFDSPNLARLVGHLVRLKVNRAPHRWHEVAHNARRWRRRNWSLAGVVGCVTSLYVSKLPLRVADVRSTDVATQLVHIWNALRVIKHYRVCNTRGNCLARSARMRS